MAHQLPPEIIDLLLLGAPARHRQLQDLPILGDVWSVLAQAPGRAPDLLIIPCWGHPTGEVAALLREYGERHNREGTRSVAFIEGIVVATLSLQNLVDHVIAATKWWKNIQEEWTLGRPSQSDLARWINGEIRNLHPAPDIEEVLGDNRPRPDVAPDGPSQSVARLGALLGTFLAAEVRTKARPQQQTPDWRAFGPDPTRIFAEVVKFLGAPRIATLGTDALSQIFKRYDTLQGKTDFRGSIFQVTTNRPAELALTQSVLSIKADAARALFSISCSDLGWAVLDSGIDHIHPAFRDQKAAHKIISDSGDPAADPDGLPYRDKIPQRIRGAFDFTRIRAILGVKPNEVAQLASYLSAQNKISKAECAKRLKTIIDNKADKVVDWRNIEKLVELDFDKIPPPAVGHGTHVAGIIGADWQTRNPVTGNFEPKLQGVCPDIGLYDFRVLGSSVGDSEFAVSAALQFIRYFNEQLGFQRIHGVNMSLAIRHNVRNYACGKTPVCKQAEALVANGVVVVAAAGNRGYLQYQLADQTIYEGYAASSITDPGNADTVITVGATHRSWPHTYGVSFFSSRGPTGDGRLKPDLLAPGERITSCIPNGREEQMDGTSMAAPHVSGAAALLMARHDELKGQPQRIKEILCRTATDLQRERHFQGFGMVDVLRAIQSV